MPDLTFHGLRHSNKTWMVDDGIEKPLQYRQLGHRHKEVPDIYSHVTNKMVARLRKRLTKRWTTADGQSLLDLAA